MSMTREEAIELVCYGDWLNILMLHLGDDDINRLAEAMCIIGNALRPVSREQMEKVWKGEWIKERGQTYIPVEYNEQGEAILHDFVVYRCSICGRENTKVEPFCNCGAPMTDEAVDILLKRLEALHHE